MLLDEERKQTIYTILRILGGIFAIVGIFLDDIIKIIDILKQLNIL